VRGIGEAHVVRRIRDHRIELAAPLNIAADPSLGPHAFDLSFDVAGTQSLEFLPLARVMRVQAHGNWPDPGFMDGFLPTERRIDARGFTANWQVLNLNRTYGDRWFQSSTSTETLLASGFGKELGGHPQIQVTRLKL
jgi:inner membrane protein